MLPPSVYGITAQTTSAAAITSSLASSHFNPLPSRGRLGYTPTPQAPASGQLKALELPPGLSRPPRDPVAGTDNGQGDDSGATLPSAISTFGGDYFSQDISLGAAQGVGEDIYQFHFPHMVQKDGTYYAYFIDHSGGSQNDVGLATSSDGRNWSKQGLVIHSGAAGAMSGVDVGTPIFFKENGTWNVYFHGLAQDGRVRVGYASGTDLKHLKVKQGPVLDVDGEGMQAGTVGDRSSVVKVGKHDYMAYETSSAEPNFGNAQWGVSLARSTRPDGGWQKLAEGEILSNPQAGFGYDGPELSVQNDRLYLYTRTIGNGTVRQELSGISGPAQEIAGRNSLASGVKTTQNQSYLLKSSTYFPG